ncbi:sigma-70 family RNA polymerase sigma factor [Nonomuraea sp. NBC_01738]|uniref:RNA polymerase sigma factor n=1 Tax=Nonomuraea sp. NBC_01738 TaxID=2976003 RepID=UPI002E1241B2|nr:sigma-70 family RNA polymerase sigma factor [Nonomuraea sp. NBC_01738]
MGDDLSGRFVEIYEHAYRPVLAYALRRCRDPDDAADVVAETFTIAWRRMEEVPAGDEARPWLFGVARNVLANHRRGELRHEQRTAALREHLAASPSLALLPDDGLSEISRVFGGLPEDDRELLALVVWEELDTAQLGQALGLSRNAVRVRLHRARKRFARALAEDGDPRAATERSAW